MTPVTTRTKTSPLFEEFLRVRRQTEDLCLPLSPEDMMVQSCAEASPAKWHLAHTTWFFETFLLREFLPGYHEFHPDFRWLFNTQYGLFDALLRTAGLPPIPWLSDPNWALASVIIADVWQNTPLLVLLFLAGLQSVPQITRNCGLPQTFTSQTGQVYLIRFERSLSLP